MVFRAFATPDPSMLHPESQPSGHPHCLLRRGTRTAAALSLSLLGLAASPRAEAVLDSNSDGISIVWKRFYNASDLPPGSDADGDGMSNAAECVAGTDPFDRNSVPKITAIKPVNDGFRLTWPAVAGITYRVEASAGSLDGPWKPTAILTAGTTAPLTAAIVRPPGAKAFFQVAATGGPLSGFARDSGMTIDSDGDGQSDLSEFMAGTDPADATSRFQISDIRAGSGLMVEFQTIPGKRYQLQSWGNPAGGGWRNEGPAMIASGPTAGAFIPDAGSMALLRISVSDIDSDGDGASDWEEIVTGFDPLRPQTHVGKSPDAQAIRELLETAPLYAIEAQRPTAVYRPDEPGIVVIRRVAGFGPAKQLLSFSGSAVRGTDVNPASNYAVIPPGEDSVTVDITALPNATTGREIGVSLEDTALAAPGYEKATVRVVLPLAYSVADFGATGNGISDDRPAIQAAIDALERNSYVNTIYFPAGRYRLGNYLPSSETNSGTHRILKLGSSDLTGRDVRFTGEPGSVLYSTVSPTRAHMLAAMASFRSLQFDGMTFEKSDVPLEPGNPEGADGVSIVRVDRRIVEAVTFRDCVFSNCHGSVKVYGTGFDVRGNLRTLAFDHCDVINPYGSNTTNVQNYWGGGQQVGMSAWVGTGRYTNCLFDGGGADMTDHTKAPFGRMKDGSHFGSPMRLEFRSNVVKRMAVEAVYQINRILYMGTTALPFVIPPANGSTPVVVTVRSEDSTYHPGQILNVRILTTATTNGTNTILRVLAWDPANNRLTLVNDGEPGNDAPGTALPNQLPIYLQTEESGVVDIRGNFLDGTLPPGAERTDPRGLVVDAKGTVADNAVIGLGTGILNYQEASVPLFPGANGLIVRDNLVVTRHPDDSTGTGTYGIETYASDISIVRNRIVCPESRHTMGIALRGRNAQVRDNRIVALKQVVNGYDSSQRAVGIIVGNTSYGTTVIGNTTGNFDVGVGPERNQWIIHSVNNHTSIGDALAVDFRGLVAP